MAIRAPFVDSSPWVIENLHKDRKIFRFFVHMDALAPICLVRVLPVGFLDHICKHRRTTAEVIGVDAEEHSPAHEDDVPGNQVKLWMLRYDVAFAWRWDVWIDEWRVPRPFSRCRRSG